MGASVIGTAALGDAGGEWGVLMGGNLAACHVDWAGDGLVSVEKLEYTGSSGGER